MKGTGGQGDGGGLFGLAPDRRFSVEGKPDGAYPHGRTIAPTVLGAGRFGVQPVAEYTAIARVGIALS